MNKVQFSFVLGMHYEDVEFDVEILNDRIIGYDSYRYIGKSIKGVEIKLIFHWDILVGILIQDCNNLEQYNLDEYYKICNYYIKSEISISMLVV
ncbi:hypothetical protein OBK28_13265 [Empedobacter falsenii]|uniref:Uncharacterized protein n=1 Tax=Empedobacter falsenii TaxID=343874 RepID=A0ABY8V5X9_9FLAO|nr:hypothetical protein [Empedobacter falsenii]WIH96552.1 hypothetical protein OBA43_09760 [Empedobacter falsenii]